MNPKYTYQIDLADEYFPRGNKLLNVNCGANGSAAFFSKRFEMEPHGIKNILTKVEDLWGNKIRNFWRFLRGKQRWGMVEVPMTYGIRSYPAWYKLFHSCELNLLDIHSIKLQLIEHNTFILERRARR
ncbi:hypothetical protein JYT22_00555 [Endomicrobium sp. AH-315-J14]|nr:hypothetical protein [Endomicrobium sp. AH-315-J14]